MKITQERNLMNTSRFGFISILLTVIAAISILAVSNPVLAAGPSDTERQGKVDDRMDPLTQQQRELHQQALQAVAAGCSCRSTPTLNH